jgi:nucleotide-binding universal stress UspA family protein
MAFLPSDTVLVLLRLVMGSVATRVLHLAACPVLLVK